MISIIMSVYNVEEYLEECLKSIFNQTYKEFELIIINDGSTDNSKKIINKYIEKYNNIIYVEQENKGLAEARNLGLTLVNGEYVLYIDSDDYIDRYMFEEIIKKINTDKSDMVIFGHSEFYDDLDGKDCDVNLNIDDSKIYSGIEVANLMLECKIMGVAWNKLYKVEKLRKENFYFEPGRYTQDWYPTFKHISNLKRISFVNKPLYKYRLRSTSTTSKKNKKRFEDYYCAVNNIINYVNVNKNKFDLDSINKFKCITLTNLIKLLENNNMLSNEELRLEKIKLKNINMKNSEILKVKDMNFIEKTYLLGWNLKIYKILMNFEKIIRKTLGR
ncbi:glycosyltransferase [Clostridium perfringens]|uniref:glycosyltransferase n=1 Tax=Clostridium perfringens TaxID=1502 RepID=UPI0024BC0EF3|nr:glycosyltransferase [Clostridium perfringens]